jgi:hypothetical protein
VAQLMKNGWKYIEPALFYGILALSLTYIVIGGYNPSLDGPSHLYNARILGYLISGNSFVGNFYTVNKVPIPNITDHLLLVLFSTVFSLITSLKLLLIICVGGFALLFRALIVMLYPENKGLSAFAIPLAHSFLFYMGFYNFCLSLVFILWTTYFYLKHFHEVKNHVNKGKYIGLSVLILVTYFTNGLALLILGLLLALFELRATLLYLKQDRANNKVIWKRIGLFILLWAPSIACFISFLTLVPALGSNPNDILTFKEHLYGICNMRPLEVFNGEEIMATRGFFLLLVLLCSSSFALWAKEKEKKGPFISMFFLLVSVVILLLYFIVPNGASVGMMSVRLCFYMFLFFTLWLVLRPNFQAVKWIAVIGVYSLHIFLQTQKHYPYCRNLNKLASEIYDAGKHVQPNSIVFPVYCTDNWMMDHFIDYSGLDKPIINPDNYEARVRWFPVVWNSNAINSSFVENYNLQWFGQADKNNDTSHENHYVFVLGDLNKMIQQSQYTDVRSFLDKKGKLIYATTDGQIHLYNINHNKQ